MIQNEIQDSICLDLFAGSGNLGIEALSNYANKVYFVDANKKCIDVLKTNLKNITENYEILNKDYIEALEIFKNNEIKFDIIFLDPPYNLDCIDKIINYIKTNNLLNENGLIICEYEFANFKKDYHNLEIIKERKYGYKNIRIYRG